MKQIVLTLVAGLLLVCILVLGVTAGVLGLKFWEQSQTQREITGHERPEEGPGRGRVSHSPSRVQSAEYTEPEEEEGEPVRPMTRRPRIVQTAAQVPLTPLAAAPLLAPSADEPAIKIEEISDEINNDKYIWPVTDLNNSSATPLRLVRKNFTVKASLTPPSKAGIKLSVYVNDTQVLENTVTTSASDNSLSITVTTIQNIGEVLPITVRQVPSSGNPTNTSNIIHLVLPQIDPNIPAPAFTGTASHKHQEPKPVANPLNSFNRFVVLNGTLSESMPVIGFQIFQKVAEKTFKYIPRSVDPKAVTVTGVHWRYSGKLPDMVALDNKTEGRILALARKEDVAGGGFHRYSADSGVNFSIVPQDGITLPQPLISFNKFGSSDVSESSEKAILNRNKESEVTILAAVPNNLPTDCVAILYEEDALGKLKPPVKVQDMKDGNNKSVSFTYFASEGSHRLHVRYMQGDLEGPPSSPITVNIRTKGPELKSVDQAGLGGEGPDHIVLQFDPADPLQKKSAEDAASYALTQKTIDGKDVSIKLDSRMLSFDETRNAVTLQPGQLPPGIYELTIYAKHDVNGTPSGVQDIYGNWLGATTSIPEGLSKTVTVTKSLAAAAKQAPEPGTGEKSGLYAESAKKVDYDEFATPRTLPNGFNPSDHVETRVSRLYYFRDAHRVTQIINRDARSYNRAAVDVKRQLAEKARRDAARATDDRKAKEREAVRIAQDARLAEHLLQTAQGKLAQTQSDLQQHKGLLQQLNRDLEALGSPPSDEKKSQALKSQIKIEQSQIDDLTKLQGEQAGEVKSASQDVQAQRQKAVTTAEEMAVKEAAEDRAKEEQFRQEVAAAHEDPDTFAPGDPENKDPVARVSISVIGEGVMQLRGPIKGINQVRLMINEIDQPVGQVKVAVHTVQVNGERGDRMEPVVARIQKYIDHSRFLTAQSGEMLRRAVVEVASRKASEAARCPGDITQEARDDRYLAAFFGQDFIDELKSLDSEFLKTGNKLLSLHSMDTTSLSSALFLLGLAKNSTRHEILATFQAFMSHNLVEAECRYFEAGGGSKAYGNCGRFQPFSCNARFASLLGYFEGGAIEDDTLTPIQREFIKLAQIFKSRLITEMELKERILARGLIEERSPNPNQSAEDAQKEEAVAQKGVKEAQKKLIVAKQALQLIAIENATQYQNFKVDKPKIDEIATNIKTPYNDQRKSANDQKKLVTSKSQRYPKSIKIEGNLPFTLEAQDPRKLLVKIWDIEMDQSKQSRVKDPDSVVYEVAERDRPAVKEQLQADMMMVQTSLNLLKNIPSDWYLQKERTRLNDLAEKTEKQIDNNELWAAFRGIHQIAVDVGNLSVRAAAKAEGDSTKSVEMLRLLSGDHPNVQKAYKIWVEIRPAPTISSENNQIALQVQKANQAFQDYFKAESERVAAANLAELMRRPIDHKKFLDMHIDDAQDKLIELLEGTRAHTANIDNYIKRISTALDDDFNTQFYHPAFRAVRSAGRSWDVQFGQIETTSILTNNRAFAKVSPQALMEFDLPKRDILIKEAFKGAKAMTDEYGALLQDPTFLALSKLGSGQPTSSPSNGAGSNSPVRNVLPGLPGQSEEKFLGQGGPGNREFGSALESLIPDPAIYKFETGTGYEIRPVIQPDGQAVVFHFQYMYTTNMREPVKADEKHLGRVKRHFIDTDVQLGNYELREVSRYQVALKASRTARGVPLLEDIPAVGALFRPLPNQQSSLQQNLILTQATIFPTLFDLMGLRWAPAVADLDSLRLINDDFVVRGRNRSINNRVMDYSSSKVDDFLRVPQGERRTDLYHSQETIPDQHPNGYSGPGLNLRDSKLEEDYDPERVYPKSEFIDGENKNGASTRPAAPAGGLREAHFEPLPALPQSSRRSARPSGRVSVRQATSERALAPHVSPPLQPMSEKPTTSFWGAGKSRRGNAAAGRISVRGTAAPIVPMEYRASAETGNSERPAASALFRSRKGD